MDSAPSRSAPRATAYVDASLTAAGAWGGHVVRIGDVVEVAAVGLGAAADGNEAEARAALDVVRRLLGRSPAPRSIALRTDSQAVVMAMRRTQGPVGDLVREMEAGCAAAGVSFSRRHSRGHVRAALASGFLNEAAHRLADMAARGQSFSDAFAYDAFWRLRLMERCPGLADGQFGYDREEASAYLGLGPGTVRDLVANRHLKLDAEGLVSARTLLRIGREVRSRGGALPEVRTPLRRLRLRMDEAGSGFEGAPPGSCPVRLTLHAVDTPGYVACVTVVEGPGGDTVHAARLPHGGDAHWATALGDALSLVFERYPRCDDLTVLSGDPELVEAFNGHGILRDAAVFDDIDRRIERDGLSVSGRQPPFEWLNQPSSWQWTFPKLIMTHVLGGGDGSLASGDWSVGDVPPGRTRPRLTPIPGRDRQAEPDGPCGPVP